MGLDFRHGLSSLCRYGRTRELGCRFGLWFTQRLGRMEGLAFALGIWFMIRSGFMSGSGSMPSLGSTYGLGAIVMDGANVYE